MKVKNQGMKILFAPAALLLVSALVCAGPTTAQSPNKYVVVTNSAPQTAFVNVSGWGNATIAPGGTATGGPARDLRPSVYVSARVGNFKTGATVPYRGGVARCQIVRSPSGTIQIRF